MDANLDMVLRQMARDLHRIRLILELLNPDIIDKLNNKETQT